jgi:hypothetical protein
MVQVLKLKKKHNIVCVYYLFLDGREGELKILNRNLGGTPRVYLPLISSRMKF